MAALVLGIIAVIPYIGILTFIPAIVCGHMALGAHRRDPLLGGRGMALAGLIMGYVALVLAALVVLAAIVFVLVTKLADPPSA